MITLDTWIISDTHFGHRNIVKFCGRDMNHDAIMFSNWIDKVHPEDTILHLGDLRVWYNDDWMARADHLINGLPGRKLLIKGNHDKHMGKFASMGFELIPEFIQEFTPYGNSSAKRVLFSHYPDNYRTGWDINIHGHIHNGGYAEGYDRNKDYRNVSIEVMNYEPVRLRDILYNGKYEGIAQAPVSSHP